jgi:hypothetical protein
MRLLALGLAAAALLMGCDAPVADRPVSESMSFASSGTTEQDRKIAELTQALRDLGPGIDPAEAARVAEIAVREPLKWAQEWQVDSSPLVHNFRVNHGMRPRGLCKDWADDLQKAMWRENLQSFDLHRAIANSRNIRLEHSVLILSAKGAAMEDGILLDPWRLGQGQLYYVKVPEDPRYDWLPREEVFAWKREWQARAQARPTED